MRVVDEQDRIYFTGYMRRNLSFSTGRIDKYALNIVDPTYKWQDETGTTLTIANSQLGAIIEEIVAHETTVDSIISVDISQIPTTVIYRLQQVVMPAGSRKWDILKSICREFGVVWTYESPE